MGRGTARGGHLTCNEEISGLRLPGGPPVTFDDNIGLCPQAGQCRVQKACKTRGYDSATVNGSNSTDNQAIEVPHGESVPIGCSAHDEYWT